MPGLHRFIAKQNPNAPPPTPADGPGAGGLALVFNHLRSNEGVVRVAVFNAPNGFPEDFEAAFRTVVLRPENRRAEYTLTDLPIGRYALCFYHDGNANNVLDKNILGQPTEDYGFSNGARGLFAAPKFAEAAFDLPTSGLHLTFRVERVRRFV